MQEWDPAKLSLSPRGKGTGISSLYLQLSLRGTQEDLSSSLLHSASQEQGDGPPPRNCRGAKTSEARHREPKGFWEQNTHVHWWWLISVTRVPGSQKWEAREFEVPSLGSIVRCYLKTERWEERSHRRIHCRWASS